MKNIWKSKEALPWVTNMLLREEDKETFLHWKDKYRDHTVLEFGCGAGRVASFFSEVNYAGVDFNPACIERAKKDCPKHHFYLCEDVLPKTEVLFANEVLLHVPDADLLSTLKYMLTSDPDELVIREVMDFKLRAPHRKFSNSWNRYSKYYIEPLKQLEYTCFSWKDQIFDYHGKPTIFTTLYFEKA